MHVSVYKTTDTNYGIVTLLATFNHKIKDFSDLYNNINGDSYVYSKPSLKRGAKK